MSKPKILLVNVSITFLLGYFKKFGLTVILLHLDEPSRPGQPAVKDYDKNFVQLQWARPETDGGSPITGYIIERKNKYS